MTDLLINLRKEIKKWEEGEEEYERKKEEVEEHRKEKDGSAKKNTGEFINFIRNFQELLQFKVKVHDLIYFHLIMFV